MRTCDLWLHVQDWPKPVNIPAWRVKVSQAPPSAMELLAVDTSSLKVWFLACVPC